MVAAADTTVVVSHIIVVAAVALRVWVVADTVNHVSQ
jgi:hypothetical protein